MHLNVYIQDMLKMGDLTSLVSKVGLVSGLFQRKSALSPLSSPHFLLGYHPPGSTNLGSPWKGGEVKYLVPQPVYIVNRTQWQEMQRCTRNVQTLEAQVCWGVCADCVLLVEPQMLRWEKAFRDLSESRQETSGRSRGGLRSEGDGISAGPNESRASYSRVLFSFRP